MKPNLTYRQLDFQILGASLRTESYMGEEHLVVPCVALVGDEVVYGMNADGPELVPADELELSTLGWSGRPILTDHPANSTATANDPRTLESLQFGQIFNPRFTKGCLQVEAWLGRKRAKKVDGAPEIIARCERGEMVELSIGAIISLVKEKGTTNGKSWSARWESIMPDHLAIGLNGSKGACNIEMGCGANRSLKFSEAPRQMRASRSTIANPAVPRLSATEAGYAAENRARNNAVTATSTATAPATPRTTSAAIPPAQVAISNPPATIGANDMERILHGAFTRALAAQQGGPLLDQVFGALDRLTLSAQSGFLRGRMATLTGANRHRDIDQLFYNHLPDLRTAAGLTQKTLADQLGLTSQTVSNYETHTTNPPETVRDAVVYHLMTRIMTRLDQEIPIPENRTDEAYGVYVMLSNLKRFLFLGRSPQMPAEGGGKRPDPHGINKYLAGSAWHVEGDRLGAEEGTKEIKPVPSPWSNAIARNARKGNK